MFPSHLEEYVANCDLTSSSICLVETTNSSPDEENLCFEDVCTNPNWQIAMQVEYNSLITNKTLTCNQINEIVNHCHCDCSTCGRLLLSELNFVELFTV
jgi:hypothetical protein